MNSTPDKHFEALRAAVFDSKRHVRRRDFGYPPAQESIVRLYEAAARFVSVTDEEQATAQKAAAPEIPKKGVPHADYADAVLRIISLIHQVHQASVAADAEPFLADLTWTSGRIPQSQRDIISRGRGVLRRQHASLNSAGFLRKPVDEKS